MLHLKYIILFVMCVYISMLYVVVVRSSGMYYYLLFLIFHCLTFQLSFHKYLVLYTPI